MIYSAAETGNLA